MLRVCQVCGVTFEGDSAAIKCPKCADASRRSVIRARTCRRCGQAFPGGPRAWYCPQCRHGREKERARRYRQQGYTRHLGDVDLCTVCGKPYIVTAGTQKYCPDCAAEAVREIDRPQSRAWNAANATPEGRRSAKHAAAASLVCVVCGKSFHPDPRRSNAKTCSPECAAEHRRRQVAQYGKANLEAINVRKRRRRQEKLASMTPEELAAYREKANAVARTNYAKRKARQAQSQDPPPLAPD